MLEVSIASPDLVAGLHDGMEAFQEECQQQGYVRPTLEEVKCYVQDVFGPRSELIAHADNIPPFYSLGFLTSWLDAYASTYVYAETPE